MADQSNDVTVSTVRCSTRLQSAIGYWWDSCQDFVTSRCLHANPVGELVACLQDREILTHRAIRAVLEIAVKPVETCGGSAGPLRTKSLVAMKLCQRQCFLILSVCFLSVTSWILSFFLSFFVSSFLSFFLTFFLLFLSLPRCFFFCLSAVLATFNPPCSASIIINLPCSPVLVTINHLRMARERSQPNPQPRYLSHHHRTARERTQPNPQPPYLSHHHERSQSTHSPTLSRRTYLITMNGQREDTAQPSASVPISYHHEQSQNTHSPTLSRRTYLITIA